MSAVAPFHGAKLLLFVGSKLLVIRRDDIPTIPWPGMLDLPGGGREGDETPAQCVQREVFEEVGLRITSEQLVWELPKGGAVYFVAHQPEETERDIVFGTEGQGWHLMLPEHYVARADVIPHHAAIVTTYLSGG